MQEEHWCKRGTVILLDYSNGKRWAVVLIGKENGVAIFESEKEAREYLENFLRE